MVSRACFDCMTSLLQEPDNFKVGQYRTKSLPDALSYACRYWGRHLADSNLDQFLVDRLDGFASLQLLYWVEHLCHIGSLDLGISSLDILLKVLVVGPRLQVMNIQLNIRSLALRQSDGTDYGSTL